MQDETVLELELFFENVKESLKNFNKKNYPARFLYLKSRYEGLMTSIDKEFVRRQNSQEWMNEIAEAIADCAEKIIRSKKWKFQQKNQQIDFDMYVVIYLLPLFQEFGESGAFLARSLAKCWNHRFETHVEVGSFEQIGQGFSNTIFGLNIGK